MCLVDLLSDLRQDTIQLVDAVKHLVNAIVSMPSLSLLADQVVRRV